MIVVKLSDIINSAPVLRKLSETAMPARYAFRIRRIIQETDAVLQAFNDQYRQVLEQYSVSRDGDVFSFLREDGSVDQELLDAANGAIQELLLEQVELNITAVEYSMIESVEIQITPREAESIDWIFASEK